MHAPLDGDIQGLIVRIADHLTGGEHHSDRSPPARTSPRVDPVPWPTIGASAKNRSDFSPEFQPQPDRGRLVLAPYRAGSRSRTCRRSRAIAATPPRPAPHTITAAQKIMSAGAPPQVQQREHRRHDRHGHQRGPRHDDEHHVDDEAQRQPRSAAPPCQSLCARAAG